MQDNQVRDRLVPERPSPEGELPHALTLFLTRDQRRAVLRRLREVDKDRARALLRALGVGN